MNATKRLFDEQREGKLTREGLDVTCKAYDAIRAFIENSRDDGQGTVPEIRRVIETALGMAADDIEREDGS